MKHLPHILLPVFIGLLSSCTYHFELDDVGASKNWCYTAIREAATQR